MKLLTGDVIIIRATVDVFYERFGAGYLYAAKSLVRSEFEASDVIAVEPRESEREVRTPSPDEPAYYLDEVDF